MMVLPKLAIFMMASIMTESQHVNVHNYYTKQDSSQKIQQLLEEVPRVLNATINRHAADSVVIIYHVLIQCIQIPRVYERAESRIRVRKHTKNMASFPVWG